MKDYQSHLENPAQAGGGVCVDQRSVNRPTKARLFAKHAEHLNALAAEVERAMVTVNTTSA